jgi:hypothetical protein
MTLTPRRQQGLFAQSWQPCYTWPIRADIAAMKGQSQDMPEPTCGHENCTSPQVGFFVGSRRVPNR